jgi:Trm5-related predicted tRNA methylase
MTEEIDARWLLDEILENMDKDNVVVFRPEKEEIKDGVLRTSNGSLSEPA